MAVSKLPKMQAERIHAHFFLAMNYADIARCEGVRGEAVEHAIKRGLERLRKYLKDN